MSEADDLPDALSRGLTQKARAPVKLLPAADRAVGSAEVALPFKETVARSEAERCIACGCTAAVDCRLRHHATELAASPPEAGAAPTRAFERHDVDPRVRYDAHKCIQCHTCNRITMQIRGTGVLREAQHGVNVRLAPVGGAPFSRLQTAQVHHLVQACPVGALSFKPQARSANPEADAPPLKPEARSANAEADAPSAPGDTPC